MVVPELSAFFDNRVVYDFYIFTDLFCRVVPDCVVWGTDLCRVFHLALGSFQYCECGLLDRSTFL